jgi:hypothetical protein
MSLRYVTIKKFSEESGNSEKAIHHKIENGMFLEGHEYKYAPDGRILFDKEDYERWPEGQQRIPGLKNARDQFASTSETQQRRAANP